MAQRESAPVDPDEPGEHVPNLDIRLPELLAEQTGQDPEEYEYPVGTYDFPDLDAQEEEPVENDTAE